jgi:hypothetical protein
MGKYRIPAATAVVISGLKYERVNGWTLYFRKTSPRTTNPINTVTVAVEIAAPFTPYFGTRIRLSVVFAITPIAALTSRSLARPNAISVRYAGPRQSDTNCPAVRIWSAAESF